MIESDRAVAESDFEYVGFWIRVVASIKPTPAEVEQDYLSPALSWL